MELVAKEERRVMQDYTSQMTPSEADGIAPDGSEVRLLAQLATCGMAEFRLAAGKISRAVQHRTVEEIWYVVSGTGEMWRSQKGREEVLPLRPGLSLTIPRGTQFQFRAHDSHLTIVGVTIPIWPGPEEAEFVMNHWPQTDT